MTTVTIPTLDTGRLMLRAPRLADFDAYAAMVTSPRARYMQARLTRDDAWMWFVSDTAHWPLFGYGALMIDVVETGETVGQVGVTKGLKYPEPEIGWLLYDGAEGNGYVTEAATALRAWVYLNAGLSTLVSYIDPENAASLRVAKRLGAVIDADAPRPDPSDLVYRHPGPEALQ
ncbi:MAG: GNAT family N-acetyltransferase [Paracoccaceae bacterium]|nr:GNAT family N-acetyltransferase [Paracoccaceae bacterium]